MGDEEAELYFGSTPTSSARSDKDDTLTLIGKSQPKARSVSRLNDSFSYPCTSTIPLNSARPIDTPTITATNDDVLSLPSGYSAALHFIAKPKTGPTYETLLMTGLDKDGKHVSESSEDADSDTVFDTIDFEELYLVLYDPSGNPTFRYWMSPLHKSKFTQINGRSQFVRSPNERYCMDVHLTDIEYSSLVSFCMHNQGLAYNIGMEIYASSTNLQGFVSFLNGLFPCSSKTNHILVGDNDNDHPNAFKLPAHPLMMSLSKSLLIERLMNPPSLLTPILPPHDEELDDDTESSALAEDIYRLENVARARFTNSYQLHIFTYIAYLGTFINRESFLENCVLGFKSIKVLHDAVHEVHNTTDEHITSFFKT